MGSMADLVQMWIAVAQSRPLRQPPFTDTTFLPWVVSRSVGVGFMMVTEGGGRILLCFKMFVAYDRVGMVKAVEGIIYIDNIS